MTSYNIINHLSFYMKNKYAKIFTVKKRSSFLPKMANFSFYVVGYIHKLLHENIWLEHAYSFMSVPLLSLQNFPQLFHVLFCCVDGFLF